MSALFHTFPHLSTLFSHFFTLFHTFSHFFTLFHTFSPMTFLKIKAFLKIIKENKKTKPFCMLVVARLSSSVRMSEAPTTTTSQTVSQCTSNLYCNTPLVCIAVLSVPLSSQERETLQYSSHLYRSMPPICIALLLGKSRWLWSPGCSPL